VSQAFFLDTNVFVYSFDYSQPRKQKRSESLIVEAIESERCAISTQVIQEFLNVALGKFANRLSTGETTRFLDRVLWPLCKIHPSAALYVGGLAETLERGVEIARATLASGAAERKLEELRSFAG